MKLKILFSLYLSVALFSQSIKQPNQYVGHSALQNNHFSLIKTFTEKNGLSSNQIYDITQDRRGFLWIATENGVSRFDGVRFYNYSVSHGLPSNDVIQIFTDKNGRVWANCYMKPLSYFDEKANRFIKYSGYERYFKNLRVYIYNKNNGYYTSRGYTDNIEIGDTIRAYSSSNLFTIPNLSFLLKDYKFENNKLILNVKNNFGYKTLTSPISYQPAYHFLFNNSIICYGNNRIINQFKLNNDGTIRRDSLILDNSIYQVSFSRNNINVLTKENELYSIDLADFSLKYKFKLDVIPNVLFTDRENNIWIGSLDGGLFLYRKNSIASIPVGSLKNRNFQFVSFFNNDFYTGNYFGEVVKNGVKQFDIKDYISDLRNPRVNNIIKTGAHTSHGRKKFRLFLSLSFEDYFGVSSSKYDEYFGNHISEFHRNAPFCSFVT